MHFRKTSALPGKSFRDCLHIIKTCKKEKRKGKKKKKKKKEKEKEKEKEKKKEKEKEKKKEKKKKKKKEKNKNKNKKKNKEVEHLWGGGWGGRVRFLPQPASERPSKSFRANTLIVLIRSRFCPIAPP